MRLGITNDHRGYKLKVELLEKLKKDYEVIDYGAKGTENVDYPDYAFKLGEALANKEIDFGIAICGSGIGISIACNKVKGVRAARVVSLEDVIETRGDNDANIICLNENMSVDTAYNLIITFITTPFSGNFPVSFNEHNHRMYSFPS